METDVSVVRTIRTPSVNIPELQIGPDDSLQD